MSEFCRRALAAVCVGLFAVASAVVAPAAGAETETVEGRFDMLTYNVAGLPEVISGSNPEVNMALISPLLNAYDLVVTQEDFANPDPPLDGLRVYHEDLISAVDHPYLSEPQVPPMGSDPDRPDALLGDGLNILSRMPFGSVTRVTWEDCFGIVDNASDCLATKGFAVTTMELAPGVPVDVYDLHAEAGRGPEDHAARAANYVQLAEFINTHSAGKAVIVGGDMNLRTDRTEDAEVWRTFLDATGITDVCEVVDCGADANVIDKIAFRSNADIELTPLSHTFERDRFTRFDGEPLSDHDPLHVAFAFSAQVAVPTTPPSTSPTTSPDSQLEGTTTAAPTTTTRDPGTDPTVHPSGDRDRARPARAMRGSPDYVG